MKVGFTSCYYNPCNFSLRKENYIRFHDCLGEHAKDLLTVELAFNDAPFHLEALDNRISFRSNTVLWQKEALLNLGVAELLNRGYDYIVWLDADIKFHNEDWYDRLCDALPKHNLIQVFKTIKRHDDSDAFKVMKGTVASIQRSSPATGFGWGCPAAFFEDGFRLYDRLIIGGGDTLIYAAGDGTLKDWLSKRRYSLPHIKDIVNWSNEWYPRIVGNLGYAENAIDTFYHGNLKNRNYLNRHDLLLHNEFDPVTDISRDENLLWEWSSEKPDMHNKLTEYFASREEDG